MTDITKMTNEVISERLVRTEVAKATFELTKSLREQDIERQAIEDARSIKRNKNRMYTLFGAMLISLVITLILYYPTKVGIPLGLAVKLHPFAPFSFFVTVGFDSCFTVWAFIHRY
jgi:hypothetical protein